MLTLFQLLCFLENVSVGEPQRAVDEEEVAESPVLLQFFCWPLLWGPLLGIFVWVLKQSRLGQRGDGVFPFCFGKGSGCSHLLPKDFGCSDVGSAKSPSSPSGGLKLDVS